MTDQQQGPDEQDRAADSYAEPAEQAQPVDQGDEEETAVDAVAAEDEDDAPADESDQQ